ncbi:MAG: NRDE family protein [Deltaproteobacteria bacterium]|nr:NRDE family protein [Deltaproteobacteria bacterium]
MCLMLFAFRIHHDYRFIFAGNRDEFYDRPTLQAAFREEDPGMLAGKDLQGGGTWFGVTREGRFAGLTNYRDPKSLKKDAPSRGMLVSRFLTGSQSPSAYIDSMKKDAHIYNGFNLILGNRDELSWYSNRGDDERRLGPGMYGLSNHLLDTPWPKVKRGKAEFTRLISETDMPGPGAFFSLLEDRTQADDNELPDTGVGLERERMLSAVFVSSPDYGTCSSTLLLIGSDDHVTFMERTFNKGSAHTSPSRYDFKIEPERSG